MGLQAGYPKPRPLGRVPRLAGYAAQSEEHFAGVKPHGGHDVVPLPEEAQAHAHILSKNAPSPQSPGLGDGLIEGELGAEVARDGQPFVVGRIEHGRGEPIGAQLFVEHPQGFLPF